MHPLNIIKKFLIGATLLHNVIGRPLEVGDSIGAPDLDNSTIEARATHEFWAIWSSEQIATSGGGPADPGHVFLHVYGLIPLRLTSPNRIISNQDVR